MEMVRRSERALGLAIREGQFRGEITRRGQGGGVGPGATSRSDHDLARVTDFASINELSGNSAGIYDLTDHVTEEEFEVSLSIAREEGHGCQHHVRGPGHMVTSIMFVTSRR
ncbi:hypothetical protein GY21_13515 [Cryobacterium roopkundense]|uniref:Uncharacterized protein n=1 Tax=Cryobacterium roopkundense TaxID=1001240 RepID=A0A099J346_9MICO|nr:hypothetical protein GY21_13515 [Cryobacterium roopkundense]